MILDGVDEILKVSQETTLTGVGNVSSGGSVDGIRVDVTNKLLVSNPQPSITHSKVSASETKPITDGSTKT
ncbi:hypothetical protein BVC80_1831g30 [Macleaya cordata]|uniref:Uncharacterized protein n=1 Tax=Macleaya cordata TaxID=56857 RepID=A0A200R713_MACCD|nr:hypothetical protein BVC80_1831g30 [Macleaya cordata]